MIMHCNMIIYTQYDYVFMQLRSIIVLNDNSDHGCIIHTDSNFSAGGRLVTVLLAASMSLPLDGLMLL